MGVPADVGGYSVRPIGIIRSPFTDRKQCPNQAYDGAPEAWVEIDPACAAGLRGIAPGAELILLTWLHAAARDVLQVHPRRRPEDPVKGVFLTRSPDRPNPIGLHRVEVVAVEEPGRFRVRALEALDGTPVLDIKSVLAKSADA